MVDSAARILVGVDGSDSSIAALRYAARLAEALHAPLEAMTTWDVAGRMNYAMPDVTSPLARARHIADESIHRAFDGRPPAGFSTSTCTGPPAKRLIDESARAGLLVLGSRGHGGFAGLLLGSVSSACAVHAHCPVLIVHGDPSSSSTSPVAQAVASGL